ncbi:MAG: hypothetical protein K6A93_11055 [Bacteroidaceae bacterium]|nr:hypothetical protein [Bacteroidaceae bacterium]
MIGAIDLAVDNFEDCVLSCLETNHEVVEDIVHEQLYSGLDGNGQYLSPTYDEDPYFNEENRWKGKSRQYKEWKQRITPPMQGEMLFLPPRPVEVPNLFIIGTFYDSIRTERTSDSLRVYTGGFRDGPVIERKYGEAIFSIGMNGKEYFNEHFLRDWIEAFWRSCGL